MCFKTLSKKNVHLKVGWIQIELIDVSTLIPRKISKKQCLRSIRVMEYSPSAPKSLLEVLFQYGRTREVDVIFVQGRTSI